MLPILQPVVDKYHPLCYRIINPLILEQWMPPVVTSGGLRTTGVPLDAELYVEIKKVQRSLGVRSQAAAMRYLMLQGLEHLREKEERDREDSLRRRLSLSTDVSA